ncbi:hypothetical protein L2E82_39672 [Cichorium intybus]|uniref:Uncharacterized protein n=1 Tax=Cichorium intybus TaxID=13427 RepID=A0ACB9AI66_CICIN|nr:hypothetical protein L2E82_39672 [Cichorium intybus]
MELELLANVADSISPKETVPEVSSPEEVYEIDDHDSLDFDSWTSLISEFEKTNSDNIKAISSVYESFLSRFPLCHEYWKKYADHMARLSTMEKAVKIFEIGVQSATYSVGLWVDYCSFSMLAFEDPRDVRRIFERGLSYVGKDFLSHKLWDMYIRFELSQQQWSSLAHILIRALKFPTKSLHKYYDNFKEFAAFIEEDMSYSKSRHLEPYADDSNMQFATSDDKIFHAIKKLQDSSSIELRSKALNKLIAVGEGYYRKSCKLHEEIDYFENYMERDSFHVDPLDDDELENWHNYLDFIEKQKDFDWALKLYERCLIPCANYPEFWMRYVEFMESKGGRELATFALERATQVFLKNVSEVHIFNARFREKIGDIEGARAAFHLCDTESDSSFIETAIKEANMEKRLGNSDTALDIYKKALKIAAEKEKIHIIPILYIHFFRLKYLITGSADAAMNLLIAGVQQVTNSRLLLEELINFAMMHEGSRHLKKMDRIMATTITCESENLSSKDREDLSLLYLKFVDHCGTAHDIRKAWNRHIKSFPKLIRTTSSQSHKESRETIPRVVHSIDHIAPISPDENHKSLNSKEHVHEDISEPNELQISQKHDQITTDEDKMLQKPEREPNPTTPEDTPPPATASQNRSPVTGSANNHHETEQHEPKSSLHQQNAEICKTQENTETDTKPVVQYPVHVQSTEPPGLGGQTMQAYNQMWQYQYQQNQNQQQWVQMPHQYMPHQPPQQYMPHQPQVQPHQYQSYQQEQYQQYWYQMYQQQQQMQGYMQRSRDDATKYGP